MLLVNQVISSMDAICMWSLNKSFISCSLWQLNSIALMLYFRFFYHLLAIPPSCNSYPCTIYLCYKGFLVGNIPGSAAMKPRAYSEKSTHACTARHTLVLRLLIMIPYTTMSVCYILVAIPRIYRSLFCLEISIPAQNLVSLSSEFTKGLVFERTVNGRKY